jgi:hypothetical protein
MGAGQGMDKHRREKWLDKAEAERDTSVKHRELRKEI